MVLFYWGVSGLPSEPLGKTLLELEARDREVRAELTAAGELDVQYHPKLAAVYRANSSRLRQMIEVSGWPGVKLAGERGAMAAWRIALHSMAEPAFMRKCRDLVEVAAEHEDVPRWQFAIIDDRVRVYEGNKQRYGTQLRVGPDGLEPHPIESESRVDARRAEAGLPPLDKTLAQARAQPQASAAVQSARDKADLEFRRAVGWIP